MIDTKKLNLISLAMLLLMLCGCSGGGIMDTYWRDDKTGNWLIGLTEDRVIYDGACPTTPKRTLAPRWPITTTRRATA